MNAGRKAEPEMSVDRAGFPINRRSFLGAAAAAAGAAAASPLLAACGTTVGHTGTTSASELTKIMPAYVPTTAIKPDIPSVNGSDPAYLTYPTNLVHTISEAPGAGGSYTTITPLWGAIPAAGNPYYQAVNQALGADLTIQPANGNTYANALPPLFSGNKLPDWINIPSWNTQPLNFGQAVAAKFADLTPYLGGDKVKKYPNLANIAPAAWQAGIWNNKIYGLPVFPSNVVFAGTIFYRQDILGKLGITPNVKSAADLFALGKEVNNPKGKRWAFDDPWSYLTQPFNIPNSPPNWTTNAKGDLVASVETEQYIEALNWRRGDEQPAAAAHGARPGRRLVADQRLRRAVPLGRWRRDLHPGDQCGHGRDPRVRPGGARRPLPRHLPGRPRRRRAGRLPVR
jgi:putative aldouronate transport system substrate-binding protein